MCYTAETKRDSAEKGYLFSMRQTWCWSLRSSCCFEIPWKCVSRNTFQSSHHNCRSFFWVKTIFFFLKNSSLKPLLSFSNNSPRHCLLESSHFVLMQNQYLRSFIFCHCHWFRTLASKNNHFLSVACKMLNFPYWLQDCSTRRFTAVLKDVHQV